MSDAKKAAAEKAVALVKPQMLVGLGTGSTALYAIEALGKRVQKGETINAVASSVASEQKAREAGINIVPFDNVTAIDIYIDGADEVDEQKNLIKGGGGALLREKILAHNSKQFVVIVDETKLVKQLGRFHLPVEIVPFAYSLTMANIGKLGSTPQLRMKDGKPFVTDNGNYIVDGDFGLIYDPVALNESLHSIPGVVEIGLFAATMVNTIFVGTASSSAYQL